MAVSVQLASLVYDGTDTLAGISAKVTQSVLTAAFLFAFKDVLYDATIKARRRIALKV